MDKNVTHTLKEKFRALETEDKIFIIVVLILLLIIAVSYLQEFIGGNSVGSRSYNSGGARLGGLVMVTGGPGGGPEGPPAGGP